MSSWYMFNAMGFYPMNPASAEYVVGSPIFDRVEVKLPQSDHTLTINAPGAKHKPFIKSLAVDEVDILSPIIYHDVLLKAKTINFEMSDKPETWGANKL